MRCIILAIFSLCLGSCGTREHRQSSELKLEIQVPPSQVNANSIKDLLAALEDVSQHDGRGVLSLDQLIAVIPFTASELDQIKGSRSHEAEVTCRNLICTGTNSGRGLEINASRMDIPAIGVPHFSINDQIRFKFRLGRKNFLDVCSVEGFAVKKLFFWSEIHAAEVALNDQSQATKAVITASPTTYTRCD